MPHTNGANGAELPTEMEYIMQRARQGSRSLPFMTDTLGNSLNDRLLFAVPKSESPALPIAGLYS
jgi:ATP phosphoribosyltransferase